MKAHPIISSILIILLIVAVMSAAIVGAVYFSNKRISPVQFGDRIALIDVKGTLTDGGAITSQLRSYANQKSIKAIIIRIDSPGGGVAAAQEVYREIGRTRASKPVIAYMADVAASGGYYIACAANKIVANPGTLTGSIGVIMQFANLEELMNKIGISSTIVKAGRFKDIGSPSKELTPDERTLLQSLVDEVHSQFIKDVAKGRNMEEEKVREIADGRIMTGQQAQVLGLVDTLGNLHDAIDVAKELANIKGEARLVNPEEKKLPGYLDFLLEGVVKSVLKEMQAQKVHMSF